MSGKRKEINPIIGKRIKKLRESYNMEQQALAKQMGLSKSAVSKVESGNIDVSLTSLEKYAQLLNTNINYLIGKTDNPNPINIDNSYTSQNFTDDNLNDDHADSDIIEQDTVEIPIYGDVAAGIGCFADDNIIGYEDIPQSWVNPYDQYILLRVKGDSMFPKFEEDDLLLVKAQNSVDSGDYAIALIDDENGVVKRIMYGKNWIELISVNPAYPPRRFEGADVMRIRIVGIVKKSIRDI